MVTQLALNLTLRDEATFANFYPGDNQALLTILQNFMQNTKEPYIYFWGMQGVGRSHLLQACCHFASENNLSALYLPLQHYSDLSPEILNDLENQDLICIDDIDVVCQQKQWEEAIFHCYNRSMAGGAKLLITGNAPPSQLNMSLLDLKSRLTAGIIFQLKSLTDEQKILALQLRAKIRGLILPEEVARYVLQHAARDLDALFFILDKLDKASLVAQKRLTIPFVKKVWEFKVN